MATFENSPRVGRSQAAVIFWGLISVFFASGFCYFFIKNRDNEKAADSLRGQVLSLQDERDALSSQKSQLEANASETATQLNTREEFLNDKEAKLAQEESQLEVRGQQSVSQSQQNQIQTGVVRKFNDVVRKLAHDGETDVVVRGGRPVLRIPGSVFFAYGDVTLKPEGKAVLAQVASALDGQLDNFELRVETFTDSGGETDAPDVTTPKAPPTDKKPNPTVKTEWSLTGARAAALAQYFRQSSPLPFQNILIVPRADTQPIVAGKEGHARNRRVEITITPMPVAYHPPDNEDAHTGGHAKSGHLPKEHIGAKSDKDESAKSSGKPEAKTGDKTKVKDDASPSTNRKAAKPKDTPGD